MSLTVIINNNSTLHYINHVVYIFNNNVNNSTQLKIKCVSFNAS